jgi:diadenosine tetraphosphate (Ap4A) HIT family hydrolase
MKGMEEGCLICQRVLLCRQGQNPYLIHEFEHSFFVVGDHQFHHGYSLLLLKEHARELHELPPAVRTALFQEVMVAAQAMAKAFRPWKMNYACYGNTDPHVHWHLFPRYESDPDHRHHPWVHSAEFKDHLIDPETAREMSARIKVELWQVIEELPLTATRASQPPKGG